MQKNGHIKRKNAFIKNTTENWFEKMQLERE